MVATTRTKADKAQRQADQLEKKSERVLNREQAKKPAGRTTAGSD